MSLIISNPIGLWALLGIPAVLVIHFLQHEARRFQASTLFLLEHLAQESTEGRVFERIRNSAQLWLQLLAVLLLTWLLIQPRWQRPDSFQRIVVVLDSSVSMTAYQSRVADQVGPTLRRLDRAAATTEWRLIESDSTRPTLYAGTDLSELLLRMGAWNPRLGTHDVSPALDLARSLAGARGTVILVSDHMRNVSSRTVGLIGVGKPFSNLGFTGLRVSGDGGEQAWHAMVRNHGANPAVTTWHAVAGETESPRQPLELGPGESRVLKGSFPPDVQQMTLQLGGDEFTLDDQLHLLRPIPKRLEILSKVSGEDRELVGKFVGSIANAKEVGLEARHDIEIVHYEPGRLPVPVGADICIPRSAGGFETLTAGLIVQEKHELTDGLTWQGLLCRPVGGLEVDERVTVLVWLGKQPILALREDAGARQLIVGFTLAGSNADRLPAFVILLHRFVEQVRLEKKVRESRNVEANQRLELAVDIEGPELILQSLGIESAASYPSRQAALVRAPREPCFFTVRQGERDVFRGAARFADAREADFREASSFDQVGESAEMIEVEHSRSDPWIPMWIALVAAALMLSWVLPGGRA